MNKAQERVIFFTTALNYTFQVKPERKGFDGEVPFILPARLIKFEGGHYSTDDKETIELIRNCKQYRRGKITEEAKKEVLAAQETHRGAISTTSLRKEAGVAEKPQAIAFREKGVTVCDFVKDGKVCGKTFENDFGGRRLSMHKVAHRRWDKTKEAKVKK